MLKVGITIVQGPWEVLAMTRMSVEGGSSVLHVAADALGCTTFEADEKISRREAFTGYDGAGKAQLPRADLTETISSLRDDGFRALKFYLQVDHDSPQGTTSASPHHACV
jgi:hypothetical protein